MSKRKAFVSSNFRSKASTPALGSVCTTFTEELHPKLVDGESVPLQAGRSGGCPARLNGRR